MFQWIDKLRKRFQRNKGSLVIEATFVYPLIFFVLMFLLYMGNMYYLKARIDSEVSQEAMRYAALYADPNLDTFEDGVPTSTEGKNPSVTNNLYRYVNFGIGDYGEADTGIKNDLISRITDTGFFSGMTPYDINVVKHEANNYVIYQTYEVEVSYKLKIPIRFLFTQEDTVLDLSSREEAAVTDTAEFIRNVDMAVDYVEQTKAGESYLTKMNEVYGRVNEFINGEKYDPSEAVAGGSPGGGNKVTSAQEYAEKVSDKTKVNGTYAKSYSASDILREELYAAGVSNPPYGNAAHHIVPWNDSRAKDAREILDEYGIEYNSAANGVFLPMEKNDYTGNTTMHVGNHSPEYIDNVTDRLKEIKENGGSQKEIVDELNKIREELLNGTLKLNESKK